MYQKNGEVCQNSQGEQILHLQDGVFRLKDMNNRYIKSCIVCCMVAVMGAGCASDELQTSSSAPDGKKPVTEKTQVVSEAQKAVTTTQEEPEPSQPTKTTKLLPDRTVDPSELPSIDASWKTYTSPSLKFSFLYPLRGRYAPEWSVSVLNPEDPNLDNGCYKPEADERAGQTQLVVGETVFCITREMDAGAGQRLLTDSYTFPRIDKIVRVAFTKRLALGDLFDDERCHGNLVISSGTTCTVFDEALYRAHLDQIMKTYRFE